VQTQIWPSPT